MTNEELLKVYEGEEFVKYDSGIRGSNIPLFRDVKKTFLIEIEGDHVALKFTKIENDIKYIETKIIIKDDTEEYSEKTEYLPNIKKEVSVFLHELKLHHLREVKIFENGIKINEEDYSSIPIPGEEN